MLFRLFNTYDMINSGYITDKNLLPVTRLNFGRTLKTGPTTRFTLGPFECSGRHQSNKNGIPTNCKDLFHLGYIHNGFYVVSNSDDADEKEIYRFSTKAITVKMIYCDFNRLTLTDISGTAQEPLQHEINTVEFQEMEIKLNNTISILAQHLEASE